MLLETYMKKNNWELEKAANGLLAMQAFQNRLEGFDVIFMGMSSRLDLVALIIRGVFLTVHHRHFHASDEWLRVNPLDSEHRSRASNCLRPSATRSVPLALATRTLVPVSHSALIEVLIALLLSLHRFASFNATAATQQASTHHRIDRLQFRE